MSGFIAIAGLLTLGVLVALLFPLLRRREGSAEAWRSGGLAAVLVAVGASMLYPLWSNFDWNAPAPAADSPEAMVGRLARRLEKQPDDLAGWLKLGRSYLVLQQYPLAVRAYERANKLSNGKNAEASMGLGESLFRAGRSDLAGRSGRLFEQAMEAEPDSAEAVYLSALAAGERNELPLAKQRFQRLLDSNPPPEVRKSIEELITALDAQSRLAANAPGSPAPAAAKAPATQAPAANTAVVTVPLRVTLSASVAGKAKQGAPLFVYARAPGQRMPLVSKLPLAATFPQDVDLLSTDIIAGMGGGGFVAGQEIEIEARIANGGGANSVAGDPFGTVRVKAGVGPRVTIEINRLKP